MKQYIKVISALLALSALLCGCQCSVSRGETQTFEDNTVIDGESELIQEVAVAENEAPLTYEEVEEFYRSLPAISLPADWRSAEEDNMVPVPERIYKSPVFGFEYPFEVFNAARLPEKDGTRLVLVHIEDMGEYVTMYLYAFREGKMEFTDRLVAYDVREIDGGQNTLVKSFEIAPEMEITATAEYFGNGEDGEFVKLLFRKEYLTVTPEGRFENVPYERRETVSYTEQEYEYDGEYYGNYNFTVTTYRPAYLEEEDVWERHEPEVKRYKVNDEGWLVEVESFDE